MILADEGVAVETGRVKVGWLGIIKSIGNGLKFDAGRGLGEEVPLSG